LNSRTSTPQTWSPAEQGEKISTIIPCFDAATTIAETISSALAQGQINHEIVLIDDGSSDGSLEIARSFEPRLRVLNGPNRGASAARNRGIVETTGEWIVFLDADDLLVSGTLRQRVDTAEATGADVVVCDWQELLVHGAGTEYGAVRSVDRTALEGDAEAGCATHVWATTAALLYRRGLVEKIGGFREDLPVIQDARFLFDAAYHGARFAHSPHLGARHRLSPQSLSRRDPAQFGRDVLLNGKQIEALWRARGSLSTRHQEALKEIYYNASRRLFAAADPQYFEAVAALQRLGGELPLHPRIAGPLARALGLYSARRILNLLGR
jgi:glycosyltransferase involved in cell wall biosynthesis